MEVRIKDVKLKTLPDGGVIDFKNFAIPSDAQVIEKKKPAPKKVIAAKLKQVRPAIGGNTATPVANITKPKGFNVELLYSVPGGEQGSWVNLCNDDKGRIYASDQYGALYRFTPPAPGEELRVQGQRRGGFESRTSGTSGTSGTSVVSKHSSISLL